MFYSHTFLAKKSPLGTVWIAAHLQHKLRKSHVAVTNISSTVDCIIFPEVPIALRLSGHLLLGIVRIYSKKVDYLFHECNDVLSQMRTMFASVHVNLPDDADRATFQAVTLPETFELDALELGTIYEETPDKHLRNFEQITLPDQMPFNGEPFVAFDITEERFDSTPQPELRSTSSEPMDENILHTNADYLPLNGTFVDFIPPSADMDIPAHSFSPIEVARNAQPGLDLASDSVLLENAILDRHGSGETSKGHADVSSPASGLLPVTEEESLSPLLRERSPSLPFLDVSAGLDGHSIELELEPSPPAKGAKRRTRKRKHFFDATLVLSNREMKRQLNETGEIVRKRRKLPFLNSLEGKILDRPLFPGMCIDLQKLPERPVPEKVNADDMDAEIELARDGGAQMEFIPEYSPFSIEREDPASVHLRDSSAERTVITPEPEIQLSSEIQIPPSRDHFDQRSETSPPNLGDPLFPEDYLFLDAESTVPGSGITEIASMSTRTRLVANFFKDQSPLSRRTNEECGQLSLTRILQGKTRKQCARMFFETLVLKTCDLVGVNQDEAYSDIWVSLKPALQKLNL